MNLVRQQFIWSHKNQTKNDSKMFQVYKLTVAAYLISMSFYGWRDQKLNPKNIHGMFWRLLKRFSRFYIGIEPMLTISYCPYHMYHFIWTIWCEEMWLACDIFKRLPEFIGDNFICISYAAIHWPRFMFTKKLELKLNFSLAWCTSLRS